jgi:hypothetical protein
MVILMKYVLLIPALLLASNVYAAEIDGSNGTFNTSITTGTDTQVCKPVLFIKRNLGTLVKGLKTTNLKIYEATHIADNTSPTSGKATNPIIANYTMTPTANPGVYDICVTPSDFTWTISDAYEFRFLVNGVDAADHGSFILRLQN